MLIKPKKLQPGDKIATVSPSWGGAGEPDLIWRYEQGVRRLEQVFDLQVVPMPHSLKGADYLYRNPEARAEDLMKAFQDEDIKAIIANIGGDDSIRLLPYVDFDIIRENPKILMGYSDVTVTHLFCLKAGLSSIYGPALMTDFAENVEMDAYTVDSVKRTLFSDDVVGEIRPSDQWTSEFLEWEEANKHTRRTRKSNAGYEIIQGSGIVRGRLIGGCMEVLEFAKETILWPEDHYWKNNILFFETSEEKPNPDLVKYWLRNYAAQGILKNVNGIIFGKPMDELYYEEYKEAILTVMAENELENMPIMYNMNFGHTEPKFLLPYGAMAELNCETKKFSILESGVR